MAGCAALGQLSMLLRPPTFEQAADRPTEFRLSGPSPGAPLGGAQVGLWLEVTNPNPFGFTLTSVDTELFVDETRAAAGEFPLGLPLGPSQSSVIPLDLTISFADVPELASTIRRAAAAQSVSYHLDGTVGVDAGRLGQPTFGPMLLARGAIGAPNVTGTR